MVPVLAKVKFWDNAEFKRRRGLKEKMRYIGGRCKAFYDALYPKAKETYNNALAAALPETVRSSSHDIARFKKALYFLLLYVFIILALITVISTVAIRRGKSVVLPKVEGMQLTDGLESLRKHGFPVLVDARSVPNIDKNSIVHQSPRGGSYVKKGRIVRITINRGIAAGFLENYVGRNYRSVVSEISNVILAKCPTARILPPVYVSKEGYESGVILEQSPSPREEISDFTAMSFVVNASKNGSSRVAIADYTGRNFSEVVEELEGAGVVVNITAQEVTEKAQANTILSQSVTNGVLGAGSSITLTVGMSKRTGYQRMSVTYKRFYLEVPKEEKSYTLRVELADNFGKTIKFNNTVAPGDKIAFPYSVHGSGTLTVYLNDREYDRIAIE